MDFDIEFASCSDIGKIREKNEDSVLIVPELRLAAVADGMGGHNAGEVASNLAVSILRGVLYDINEKVITVPKNFEPKLPKIARNLLYAAAMANERIITLATENPKRRGMGTTLSAVYFEDLSSSAAVHIGDTRIYLLRDGEMRQISIDHSYIMEQVERGVLTKEQAEKSRIQNILTRALGLRRDVMCDVIMLAPKPGDIYMLCSDGVNKGIGEQDIKAVLSKQISLGKMCQEIVKTASRNDGKDNISCIIAKIHNEKKKKRRFFNFLS